MTNNISCYQEPDPDAPDPDSDVPDELCFIFASYSDRNSVAELLFFQGNQENPTPKPSSATPPVDNFICTDLFLH